MSKLAKVMKFDEERTGTEPRKNWRNDERFDIKNAFDMLGEPLPWYIRVCQAQAERVMCGEDEWQLKETIAKREA